MHILLTNDDGFQAKGLRALYEAISVHHKVTVVAPETEQSAIGHAITVADPIRVREITNMEFNGFAVRGTPADCVKLAVLELLQEPPDLVISGINHGANLGVNVLYSGTVSAASDAAILGFPAIAFSQEYLGDKNTSFEVAAHFARRLVDIYPELQMPRNVLLNVNIPHLPQDFIKGVRFVRQSNARLAERFEKRMDPRGSMYYWQVGETMDFRSEKDTDVLAMTDGYITITPLGHDLTHQEEVKRLQKDKSRLLPEIFEVI